jgi:hypothetical protein
LASLWYFLKAVVLQWVNVLSLLLLGFEVYEKVSTKPRKVSKAFIRNLILLCIAVAVYMAFNDEREKWVEEHAKLAAEQDKVAKLEKQLAEKNPELLGDMNYIDIAQGDAGQQVWILATVRNLGSPSVVEFAPLVVTLKDGRRLECAAMEIADREVLHFQGGKTSTFSRTDSLAEKGTMPIPNGGQIRGWLKFYSKQLPITWGQPDPLANIAKFEVQFRDVTDKNSAMFRTTEDLLHNSRPNVELWDGAVPVLPGANQPFRNVLTPEVSPRSTPHPRRRETTATVTPR